MANTLNLDQEYTYDGQTYGPGQNVLIESPGAYETLSRALHAESLHAEIVQQRAAKAQSDKDARDTQSNPPTQSNPSPPVSPASEEALTNALKAYGLDEAAIKAEKDKLETETTHSPEQAQTHDGAPADDAKDN